MLDTLIEDTSQSNSVLLRLWSRPGTILKSRIFTAEAVAELPFLSVRYLFYYSLMRERRFSGKFITFENSSVACPAAVISFTLKVGRTNSLSPFLVASNWALALSALLFELLSSPSVELAGGSMCKVN